MAKHSILLLITLVAALLTTETVNGAYQTENTFECNTCISGGSISCRPTFYDRYSFCCTEPEVGSRGCGGDDVFCSGYALSGTMNPFSCPYENNYCGASSSELEMHPESRNNLVIDIANSQFQNAALCYYQVFVKDGSLDEKNNRYFWDVEFQSLTNVVVSLSNGTDYATAADSVSVSFFTGYRFQFEAPRNQLWMSFTGSSSDGDADPAFKLSMRLRTFPTTSIADETESNAEVRIVYVEVEEEYIRKRKEQLALTVLIGVSMIGIFLGICLNCSRTAKHQSQKTKKVSSGSFHEIEIKPRMNLSKTKENTSSQMGMASISVADGNTGYPITEEGMEGKRKTKGKHTKMNRADVEGEEEKEMDRNFDGTKAKKRQKKSKNADMLNVRDDEMNNSWESSHVKAEKFDLSNQLPTIGQNPRGGKFQNSYQNLRLPSYQGSQKGDNDEEEKHSQSYQSVRDEIEQIEDVVDGLSQAPGDSSGNSSMRSAKDLNFGKRNKQMNMSAQIARNNKSKSSKPKKADGGGYFANASGHDMLHPHSDRDSRSNSPRSDQGKRNSEMRSSAQQISSARFN